MVKRKLFLGLIAVLLVATLSFALAEQTGQYDGGIAVDQDNPGGNINIDVGPSGGGSYNPYCGDGIVNQISEYCDGSDLNAQSCASYLGAGYTGSLSCYSQSCTFNTASCAVPVVEVTPTGGSGGSGGSGGGSGGSCAENWVCGEWNSCNSGVQTRTCTDQKKCGTTKIKPVLQRDCTVEGANGEAGVGAKQTDTSKNGFSSFFTGAFLGTNAGKWSLGVLIFLILVGLAWWIVAWKKKDNDEKPVKVVKMSQMKKK